MEPNKQNTNVKRTLLIEDYNLCQNNDSFFTRTQL